MSVRGAWAPFDVVMSLHMRDRNTNSKGPRSTRQAQEWLADQDHTFSAGGRQRCLWDRAPASARLLGCFFPGAADRPWVPGCATSALTSSALFLPPLEMTSVGESTSFMHICLPGLQAAESNCEETCWLLLKYPKEKLCQQQQQSYVISNDWTRWHTTCAHNQPLKPGSCFQHLENIHHALHEAAQNFPTQSQRREGSRITVIHEILTFWNSFWSSYVKIVMFVRSCQKSFWKCYISTKFIHLIMIKCFIL